MTDGDDCAVLAAAAGALAGVLGALALVGAVAGVATAGVTAGVGCVAGSDSNLLSLEAAEGCDRTMSAFGSKAEVKSPYFDVRFTPRADMCDAILPNC